LLEKRGSGKSGRGKTSWRKLDSAPREILNEPKVSPRKERSWRSALVKGTQRETPEVDRRLRGKGSSGGRGGMAAAGDQAINKSRGGSGRGDKVRHPQGRQSWPISKGGDLRLPPNGKASCGYREEEAVFLRVTSQHLRNGCTTRALAKERENGRQKIIFDDRARAGAPKNPISPTYFSLGRGGVDDKDWLV